MTVAGRRRLLPAVHRAGIDREFGRSNSYCGSSDKYRGSSDRYCGSIDNCPAVEDDGSPCRDALIAVQ